MIVGAGPAGAAAAYDLASRGQRVLLLDRRSFPRRKPCAGALTVKAVRALRYSVEPVIRLESRRLLVSRRAGEASALEADGPVAFLTVRSELDHFCLAKAREAGARFLKVPRFATVSEEADHVAVSGPDLHLTSRFLIGADGANSAVRRHVLRQDFVEHGFAVEVEVRGDGADPRALRFDFGCCPFGYGWIFPKGDHFNVGVFSAETGARPDLTALRGYLAAHFPGGELGRFEGHTVAFGGWKYEPSSDRILLAGDAAGFTEPLLGEGIYYGIRSGQEAAAAILAAPDGGADLRRAYRQRLSPIQRDLEICHRSAHWFHDDLARGLRYLSSWPYRNVFMRGYATGLSFGALRHLPFLPYLRKIPAMPHATGAPPGLEARWGPAGSDRAVSDGRGRAGPEATEDPRRGP